MKLLLLLAMITGIGGIMFEDIYKLHHVEVSPDYMPRPINHIENARDNAHYVFTLEYLQKNNCKSVYDIGSWDGWLPLLLAHDGYDVTTCEWVQGLKETGEKYAAKYGLTNYKAQLGNWLEVDVKDTYDYISAYEVLEHVPFVNVSGFLVKMERYGQHIAVSLPDQEVNKQHQWVPTEKVVNDLFAGKKNVQIVYKKYHVSNIPSNWFITYDAK